MSGSIPKLGKSEGILNLIDEQWETLGLEGEIENPGAHPIYTYVLSLTNSNTCVALMIKIIWNWSFIRNLWLRLLNLTVHNLMQVIHSPL